MTLTDKLEHIFQLQKRFDEALAKARGLDYDLATWIKLECLAMVCEVAELAEEVNFKWWKNPKPINEGAIKEELADILHFFVSTCLKAGFSASDIYEAYLLKNEENFLRQKGLSRQGYAVQRSFSEDEPASDDQEDDSQRLHPTPGHRLQSE